jgi:hypothetical protein
MLELTNLRVLAIVRLVTSGQSPGRAPQRQSCHELFCGRMFGLLVIAA